MGANFKEKLLGSAILTALRSIAVRLPLIVIGALLLISVTTGLAGGGLTVNRLLNLARENLATLARLQSQHIEQQLLQQIHIVENLAENETIQTQVQVANNVYTIFDEQEAADVLRQRNEIWRQALAADGAASTVPLVLNVRFNDSSRYVLEPEKEFLIAALKFESDFIVTDIKGAVVGASYVPLRYWYGDQRWWQEAMNNGRTYMAGPTTDESGKSYMEVAIPIRNRQTLVATGVIYGTLDYNTIKDYVRQIQYDNTGRIALLDQEGKVFYTVSSMDFLYREDHLPLDALRERLYTYRYINRANPNQDDNKAYVMTAVPLESSHAAIADLDWYIAAVQERAVILLPVYESIGPAILISFLIGIVIVIFLYSFYIRPLTGDLNRLRAGADALQQGGLQTRVTISRQDELGLLADTFNQMANQLHSQIESQEQTIAQRTASLRKQTRQLEAVAQVGRAANASLNLNALMFDAVNLIRNSFGFYHVSLFLLDEEKKYAVVHESTGEVGRIMKETPHKLAVGSESIVGWVTENQKPRIALDVGQDAVHFNNPLLPETRSEAALPLVAQGQLLGALDVQSTEANAFAQDDLSVLQLMVDQIAAAINNARLYRKSTRNQRETETLFNLTALLTTTLDSQEIYRRAARTLTEELNASRAAISSWNPMTNVIKTEVEYIFDAGRDEPERFVTQPVVYNLDAHEQTARALRTFTPILRHIDDPAIEKAERETMRVTGQAQSLEVPLVTGNEAIGVIELYRTKEQPVFTSQEIRLAQAMASQTATALTNANLTSEARGRVAELSTFYRISQALSLAPDLQSVMNSAQQEVLSLVNATGMGVKLLDESKQKLMWTYLIEYGKVVNLSSLAPMPITEGLSGYVARSGEILLLNDLNEEIMAQYGSKVLAGGMSASFIGIPLKVTNEIIGVLTVDNGDDANAFTSRDVQILTTIASSLAVAIQNQQLINQMQDALVAQSQQSLYLQAASEVSKTVSGILDWQEMLITAVHLIQERFTLYYVGIFLVDRDQNQAVLKAGTGEAGRILLSNRQQLRVGGQSLIGRATATGQARIVQDVRLAEDWQPNPLLPDTRSEMALPLRVRGQIVGALTVQSTAPAEFGPELVSIFQTMSDQLASAIDSAQLLAQTEARARHQQALNEISARLHRTSDTEAIVGIALQSLSDYLNGATVSLRLGRAATAEATTNGRDDKVEKES
jgi:GAF domain-containing protein/HAMP domain-containing protein